MEFRGRILKLSPVQNGTSAAGKEWTKQEFQFEYFEQPTDRWADKVILSVMNDRIIPNLEEGEEVICGFSHNLREWNGKWFNDLRCYKLERLAQPKPTETPQPVTRPQATPQPPQPTQPTQAVNPPTQQPTVQQEEEDGVLPF